ncbi:glycosyltransferase [Luedemannella flava]
MADVSVVVAVYNTMPYLKRCLASLARQTIGLDRMQVVLVNDGSTDGSGDRLDRIARRHPGTFEVIHQANSGGPAAPSNRGLERARGRYVFFVGADDYLEPDALATAVAMADAHASDVVAIRMAGENGRFVHQGIFARTAVDIDLATSALAWSLSNVKLFRRALIERHAIRYPEELSVSSDQPFTLAALTHARRVSVAADKIYYHVVRRGDASNITYSAHPEERLRCTEAIMACAERLLPAGPARDAVHRRQLTWEAAKLLEPGLLALERDDQEWICAGVGRLAKLYLTDGIGGKLDQRRRLRLSLARAGALDALLATLAVDVRDGPPVVVSDGRAYAAYPCFRDATLGLPDSWFDVTDHAAGLVARGLTVDSVDLTARGGQWAVTVTAGVAPGATLPLGATRVDVAAGEVSVPLTADAGAPLGARLPVTALVEACPPGGVRHPLTLRLAGLGEQRDAPIRIPGPRLGRTVYRQLGRGVYRATFKTNREGDVALDLRPVTWAHVTGWLSRRLRLKARPR